VRISVGVHTPTDQAANQHSWWPDPKRRPIGEIPARWDKDMPLHLELEGEITDEGKTFADLGNKDCRYPIGKDANGGYRFCGCPVTKGSYCAKHWDVSHGKGKARYESVALPESYDKSQRQMDECCPATFDDLAFVPKNVVYYYAWHGGPRLSGAPGSPEFVQSFHEAHAARIRPAQGCLFTLIAEFRLSAEYLGLAPSTKRAYTAYLREIEIEFGDMPLRAIESTKARGEFKRWRDSMAATPRKADYAWTTLARVLAVAKDRGRIASNPCERGGRLYAADRADRVWTDDDVQRLLAAARPEMELALMLALWTGQRQGDLLALAWSAYDGTHLRLRQSKTGAPVMVRVGEPLRALLDRAEKRSPLILTNRYGVPWTSDGFRASWRKLCAKAGIVGLTFHDLRGSAVTRLALAR
jgi:integrase